MNRKLNLLSCFCVATLVLASAGVAAQSGATAKLHCQVVGSSAPEPLGDRDGHAISVGQITCRVEGGPGDGGVLTGTTIYEWDKGSAVMLSGVGITRKPGAMSAYQHDEGKQTLVMKDGRPTGITGSGRGRYTLATGTAAPLAGKTYSYTFNSTGPNQLVVEVKND